MRLIARFAALLAPTVRAMRWGSFLAAAGVGLAVVAVPSALSVELQTADLTVLLRIAAVCAAVGAAFLLDDPAEPTIRSVPTSRLTRHALRVTAAAPVAALWWAATLAVTVAGAENGVADGLPVGALTLETAALLATALAVAALGRRLRADAMVSALAAPAVLLLVGVGALLPERVAMYAAQGTDAWAGAHDRWAGLLVGAVAAIAVAATDPVRRRLGR